MFCFVVQILLEIFLFIAKLLIDKTEFNLRENWILQLEKEKPKTSFKKVTPSPRDLEDRK